MKRLFLLLSIIAVAAGCAKNRPVEPATTNPYLIQDKTSLTGTNSSADVYFSKITVVGTSTDGGPMFVGLESDMNAGYFDFTEKFIQFKNIQGAYMGRESADSTAPIIFQFPVTHHNVKLNEVNGKTTNNIIDDGRLPWNKRPQFKIDFSKVASAAFDAGSLARGIPDCFDIKSRQLVADSMQQEDGYFSYVVENVYDRGRCNSAKAAVEGAPNYTLRFRYSFRKKTASDYKMWAYEQGELDPKIRKFGYFQSIKQEISDKDGRIKNLFIVNRWDPSKEHNFYFTKEFPEQWTKEKEAYYPINNNDNQNKYQQYKALSLTENNIITDWREPDVIRCAPVPMYNSFEDVFRMVKILSLTLSEGKRIQTDK